MAGPKGATGAERPIKEITKDIKKLVEELEKTVKAQEKPTDNCPEDPPPNK